MRRNETIKLWCCRCGAGRAMSAAGLTLYDRESKSKVLLCAGCEAETPEEARATRRRVHAERARERGAAYVAWRAKGRTK